MDYSLVKLNKNSLSLMRSLNRLFSDVFEDPESYENKRPSDEYINNFLSDKDNIVIVAIENEEVIGGLVAYHLHKFEQERSEMFIYDLAVSELHQRKGIGTKLINKLKEVSKELGAYIVFVQADEGDEAVEFYRSLQPSEDLKTINFDFPIS